MKSGAGTLLTLAGFFAVLSLFSVGGGNSAVPEMHRYAVDVQHWLTDRQFADTFALAQLTPGPNLIIVALVGFHVAGVLGAVVAMLAMCGPTGVAAYFVGQASERFKGKMWHSAISHGLVPVTIGLIAASATVIATSADYGWTAGAVTAVTAIICYFARINPIWVFIVAAVLGLAGVV
jgi:chromate transporter